MPLSPTDFPFVSDTTAYSLSNAYWLARAARIAYQDKDKIEPAVRQIGLDKFAFLSKDDTEGFVAANDKIVVVAFRGTQPSHLKDLLADAKIHKESGPLSGVVHRGFLNAFELVQVAMFDTIRRFRDPRQPQSLWCTGHSLGAALAVIAVAKLLADGQTVNGLYDFGQPRVGDQDFVDEFERRLSGRYFRFVNNNDTVTRVPPRGLGYSHGGAVRYIDSDGVIQSDMSFWNSFLDRVKGRMEDFLEPGTDGLKDHSMELYEGHIEKALTASA